MVLRGSHGLSCNRLGNTDEGHLANLAQSAGDRGQVTAMAAHAVANKVEARRRFGELESGQCCAGLEAGQALPVIELIVDFRQLRFKLRDSFDGEHHNAGAVHEKPCRRLQSLGGVFFLGGGDNAVHARPRYAAAPSVFAAWTFRHKLISEDGSGTGVVGRLDELLVSWAARTNALSGRSSKLGADAAFLASFKWVCLVTIGTPEMTMPATVKTVRA